MTIRSGIKMKKIITLLAAFSFLIFTGACFTPALYDKPAEETKNFVEEVSTFLITQDGQSLIVVGKQHHYIFTANDTLKFVLGWAEKKRVKANFDHFTISSDQTMYGSYSLTVNMDNSLSVAAKNELLKHEFKQEQKQNTLTYRGSVNGVRYLAGDVTIPATLQLNQKYTIQMTEHYASTSAAIQRVLLTPLALVGDGLLILGGIPVLLLTTLFD